MKTKNAIRNMICGALAYATTFLPGTVNAVTSTDIANAVNTPSATQTMTATPTPSATKTPSKKKTPVPFEDMVNQLSAEAREDITGIDENNDYAPVPILKAKGKGYVVVGPGKNNQFDVTLPQAIQIFSGDKNPADYIWMVQNTDSTGNVVSTSVLTYKDGKVFKGKQELNMSAFNPLKTPYSLQAKPSLSKQKRDIVIIYKDQIKAHDWDKIFFNQKYQYGDSAKKPAINPADADGVYVTFNDSLNFGGTPALLCTVQAFDEVGTVLNKGEERELDLSDIVSKNPNFRKEVDKAAGKGSSGSSAFEQTRADLSIGYANRNSSATVPILDGKGRVIKQVSLEGQANGLEISTDSRLKARGNSYLALEGNASAGSAKDSSDALELSNSSGKGSLNAGYVKQFGPVNGALEAGVAGLFEKYKQSGNIGILGPNGKVILNVPHTGTELSVSHEVLGNGKYHGTEGKLKQRVTKDSEIEASAGVSRYEDLRRFDFGGKATYYVVPGIGIYVSYGQGKSIENDTNDAKLKDSQVSAGLRLIK
ncbi:hypothetical protein JXB27_00665 [Candidatus Woesearchaeota archaeon]|nr:hypothetical protein [Candidatus Woesearchaeota archaeon]